MMGEVVCCLVGSQIEVGKDNNPGRRMLEHLRAPAGMGPRVEPLAKLEAQRGENADDAREELPRATERMMVVICPAQTQPVLSRLLNLGRAIARLPVFPLDLENQVACQVTRTRLLDDAM